MENQMTANRTLGKQRGISEAALFRIDKKHIELEECMLAGLSSRLKESEVLQTIERIEFELQALWGFAPVRAMHTHAKKYLFRKQWAGREFKCEETGATLTIPNDVAECQMFTVGSGAVDLGRLNCYSRSIGNISEITLEEKV